MYISQPVYFVLPADPFQTSSQENAVNPNASRVNPICTYMCINVHIYIYIYVCVCVYV